MKRNVPMLLLALVLVLVLLLLLSVALRLGGVTEAPGATETQTQTETETQPAPTETDPPPTQTQPAPTETDPPVTTPPITTNLYTYEELMALENEKKGYGPGRTSDGKRAPYAVSDQAKYGDYGANFIAPDNGKIYLTFDCGYEYTATDANGKKYRVTEKILNILKEKNVKAVFFVTMPYVKEQADLVRRMIDEGHAVGNHTNNHPVMTDCSLEELEYEIMSLHNYVKEHFGYTMTLLRPPTGAFSTRTLAATQNLGYKTVHWSFAYGDYDTDNQPDVSQSLDLVTRSHHSGAIYLLHAISTTNATLLPDAIDFFLDKDYELALFQ